MTAVPAQDHVEEEFAELDELEVIDSSELKLSGAYHSYIYKASQDPGDIDDNS